MKKQTFLVSDESVNTYGLKVLTEGIDTSQFERNPVMLFMHQRPLIIGRWENLQKKDGKLYADAVFDEGDPKALEIAGKVERGFLKGASIGISFKAENRNEDTIEASKLQEISIVDIGSNENALRLYNDEELIQFSLKELSVSNSLTDLLELKHSSTHAEVFNLVKTLKTENATFKNLLSGIKASQLKEANELIDILIDRKKTPEGSRTIWLSLFEKDFISAKEDAIKCLNLNPISLMSIIQNTRKEKTNQFSKAKSEWNLEDYRMFAPNELEKSPELYKRLLAKQFNQ